MGAGVAGHGHHLDGPPKQAEAIAIAHPLGLERDPLAIRPSGNHLELGPAPEQRRRATDVVVVVVGVEHGNRL